jgi:hypothetical protein
VVSAWVFDDPVFFFVGGALWLFLLFSLQITISAARNAAHHLAGERQTKERFSRSGTRIHMKTTLTSQISPGYHLEAEDILPDSATDIEGKTTGTIPVGGTCILQYSFRLLAHGTIHPGGVILRCSDAFFTITVPVRRSPLQDPALFVFPEKGRGYEGTGGYGDKETMRRTPIKSHGIRSFREYRPGDNVKTIDWKMTARHGTTYVREYTGSEGGTASVVIDLPDSMKASSEQVFSSVRKAIIQTVSEIQEQRESSQMIVLAGCDIVAVRDILPGTDTLHEISGLLAPKKRIKSLYRAYSPVMLAMSIRNAGKHASLAPMAETTTGAFSRSAAYRIEFEETMYRLLISSQNTDIHCYTTGTGDLSHIWAVASAAYALHRPMKIFLPKESVRDDIRNTADFFNVHSLEVI